MTITTKKNIGDTVFFLLNGKIQSLPISSIDTETNNDLKTETNNNLKTEVKYWVKVPKDNNNWEYKTFKENEVFDSREQLIESL